MNDRREDDPKPQPRWVMLLKDVFVGVFMVWLAIAACCAAVVQWIDDELEREP